MEHDFDTYDRCIRLKIVRLYSSNIRFFLSKVHIMTTVAASDLRQSFYRFMHATDSRARYRTQRPHYHRHR